MIINYLIFINLTYEKTKIQVVSATDKHIFFFF